jgi:NAD(P)-dependent dehydrogenase (short-subunit alcohol dehydrogenase family)
MRRLLVLGGSSGIGRAVALAAAPRGYEVIVADISPPSDAPGVYLPVDVADPVSVKALAETMQAPLDGIVNAAGIQIAESIESMTDADIARQVAVNLTGMAYVAKYFGPQLSSGASVVLVSSELAFIGTGQSPVYSATKGGITALARSLAIAWRARGIRVNALCPGATDTALLRRVWDAMPDPALAEAADTALIPLGRLATPDEIAGAALFLLSSDASFVTGHALVADGGTIIW